MRKIIYLLLVSSILLGFTFTVLVQEGVAQNLTTDVVSSFTDGAGDKGAGYNTKEWDLIGYTGQIMRLIIIFTGVACFLLLIYAGWLWMTARGNEDQITKAKDLIKGVVMGLILVLVAGFLIYFIFYFFYDRWYLQ